DDGIGLPDEHELAREEIAEGDELLVTEDHGIGALFPRQTDVQSEAVLESGPLVPGMHDARAGAGDHHVPGRGELAAKLHGEAMFIAPGLGASRTEDRDLSAVSVGLEESERVAKFADGSRDEAR